MNILIVYGSTEGQTRKIARFLFDRLIARGASVALVAAGDAQGLDPGAFDGAILAGSVHAGRYQAELIDFAAEARAALDGVPNLFLSVSLAAAGEDAEDWKGLGACIDRFRDQTGWTPARVEHVAGAFRFDEYDFFRYWAMRWIASQKDETLAPGTDREYTDWAALGAMVDAWAEELGQ